MFRGALYNLQDRILFSRRELKWHILQFTAKTVSIVLKLSLCILVHFIQRVAAALKQTIAVGCDD